MILETEYKKEILKEVLEEKIPELKDMSFHNEKHQLNVIKRLWWQIIIKFKNTRNKEKS